MRSHDELVAEIMQDSDEAKEYLKISFEEYMKDGNLEAFLIALRTVINARGGVPYLADITGMNKRGLYKILSRSGNPTLQALRAILNSLGLNLSIESVPKKAA